MNITFDINNILRTVAGAAVGLTLVIPIGSQLRATTAVTNRSLERTIAQQEVRSMKDKLTRRCYEWLWSKVDSKLERSAKNEIDEYFDGEVDYASVCRTVLG